MGTWDLLDSVEFGLTSTSVIRVSKVQNNSGEVIDIRQFYKDQKDGEWKPTKKGIVIPIKDSECSAKIVLLAALKMAGVDQKDIVDQFDFEKVMEEE